MTETTPGNDLDEYRTRHENDLTTYGEVLADVRLTIKTGLDGVATLARTVANLVPLAEEGQRNLKIQGDSISQYAKHHDEPGVSTPDQLAEFLNSLNEQERRVYEEARLGATQAARALGRHARP
jgi:hypothetical protein